MQLHNIISRIRGESKTIGLDIGHRLARVAVVGHKQGAKGTLLALEQDTVPEGVIVDNEIRNASALIDRIHGLLARAMPGGIDGDFVTSVNWTSGILCDRILVKPVPKVPENELILQTAMGRNPFDDAGNVLDFSILERREEGIEAMIVAAKKEGLTAWINLFQALNIKLAAIDVDAFVLGNTYSYSSTKASTSGLPSEEEDDDSVLLLNLGYSKSYAVLLRNGFFNTARSILGSAIHDLQEQLSGPLNISSEQACNLLMGSKVRETNLDDSKIKFAIEFIFEEMAMKVDTALRYFGSSDNYKKPSKIIVTGGGSNIIGLTSFLADRLSLDVVQLNPFKAVQIDNSRFHDVDWNAAASTYTVALGLALRRF
ncbi:MAG: pilus assembly protein PilM [Fibromonadales bacterium]|nr:pilus assembly protein PilM [Fibromonadales bacterium]